MTPKTTSEVIPRKLKGYGECKCILSKYCDGTCNPIYEDRTDAEKAGWLAKHAQPSAALHPPGDLEGGGLSCDSCREWIAANSQGGWIDNLRNRAIRLAEEAQAHQPATAGAEPTIDQVAREAIWDSAEVVHPGIDGAKEATR